MIASGIPKALGKVRTKPRKSIEFDHQCALFEWARNPAVQAQFPGIDLMSCSLNGVHMSVAQRSKAKASGMLVGEWDVRLPVARGGFVGLAIEMKAGKNRLTEEQIKYGARMQQERWQCAVCYRWDDARLIITNYLRAHDAKSNPGPI